MNTKDYMKYIDSNMEILSFIGYIVASYGKVVGLESDYPKHENLPRIHHDYVYFCITKASRSLLAANELAKFGFREDVMTLTRSVYETYLLLGNAIKDRKFIYKSVTIALGLRKKIYIHPPKNNEKIDFSNVTDIEKNKEIDFDMRKSVLARNTFCNVDGKLHSDFYKYMSEYSHSDFIGSGNYRTCNDTQYDIKPKTKYIETIFFITYMTLLIIQSIYKYHKEFDDFPWTDLYMQEIIQIGLFEKDLKERLKSAHKYMEFNNREDKLEELLLKRINFNVY